MRFLLGSSFFDGGKQSRRDVSRLWHLNNTRMDVEPTRTVVICEGGSKVEFTGPRCDTINLTGDLGHVGSHLNGSKSHEFTGWSASMTALAMIAYIDEADFLYKEEDCFAFGPWVNQMYSDLGDGQIVFGRQMKSPPWMPCAQSLFLIRHKFIPKFVSEYLSMGRDGDLNNLGETKFVNLENKFGSSVVRRLSFGVDRERPIPWNDRVWYAQQWSSAELEEVQKRGLI